MEELLSVVMMIVGLAGIVAVAMVITRGVYQGQVGSLRRFEQTLSNGRLTIDEGWFPSLSGTRLEGVYEDREIKLSYRIVGSGKNKQVYTKLEVEVPSAVPAFKVEHAGVINRLGRFLGFVDDVPTGNERVDDKYILSGRRVNLSDLFRSKALERAMDALIDGTRVTKVELRGNRMIATAGGGMTDASALKRTFGRLLAVSRQCERKQVQVKVLGEKPRLAITGGTNHALCPYCRDEVALDAEDVMACDGCNTVHHAECYAEAGGCTIYGCGKQRVRA